MELTSTHCISPEFVCRGSNAWKESLQLIPKITRKPLFLGRSSCTSGLRSDLLRDLKKVKINPINGELKFDCCEEDLNYLAKLAIDNSTDGIIASGGGKVLDAGKLLGFRLNLPVITVPLSASTCAGWTSLANIYSAKGAFQRDVVLERCPKLMIFDHKFVRMAPRRTLASGIADALAKWYEASVGCGSSKQAFVQQAVQMARLLRDQLLLEGHIAFNDSYSEEWSRIVDSCSLTAGLIGGIGGPKCRTVAAHAVHNALTQLDFPKEILHGEKVGFGILVQLRLEEFVGGNKLAGLARKQLLAFMKGIELPVSLDDMGLSKLSKKELLDLCEYACNENSDLHFLPFHVSHQDLLEALLDADKGIDLESQEIVGKIN